MSSPPSLTEFTSTPMGQEPMNFEVTQNGDKYRVKRVFKEGDLKPTQGGKRKKSKSKKSKKSRKSKKSKKSKKTRRHRK